jgi:hypothetical protein
MKENNSTKTIICPHCKSENPDISICVTCGGKIIREQLESNNSSVLVYEKFPKAIDLNKLISAIIAICYLTIATYLVGGAGFFKMFGFLILPMGCIWYGEDLGGYTGSILSQGISRPSSGRVVIFVGWLLLFLPLLQVAIIYYSK